MDNLNKKVYGIAVQPHSYQKRKENVRYSQLSKIFKKKKSREKSKSYAPV